METITTRIHAARRSITHLLAWTVIFTLTPVSFVWAANWARLMDEFAGTGKAAKGAVVSGDEAANILRRTKMTREAAAREAKYMGADISSKPLLRQVLVKTLRERGSDPSALRFVADLADEEVDFAVVLMRGGRRLQEAVPDLVTRARMTRGGGPSMLASLGLRDSTLAEDFLKIDALTSTGALPAKIGGNTSIARFGELLGNPTDRFAVFYGKYVRGHEGKWAAGGALTWWLTDPDSFQDAAGGLTEAGFRKASELGGEVLAASLRGIATGGKQAGEKIMVAAFEGYLSGPYAWAAWLALLAFGYLAGLALPFSRHLFLRPIRAVFRAPK